ncbi:Pilus assembly protein, PilO [Tepidimonas alkaliphilus]|uniref:Pilus assembly protein, PilO n=1 Tax=Tepidimonas alkaliphilus TaxID=2588942 RepID=A0A554W9G5_9BURK|nr:type 4a pilus biogenesis protein PilO [Tepidimonas alkaliphilus]TSE20219.1 Pilus assembly protein, PilO [Tepidimonas alkaliphilus]
MAILRGKTAARRSSIDWAAVQQQLQRQFTRLDPNDPSRWPALPRALLLIGVALALLAALWYLWLSDQEVQLDNARQRESELRTQFTQKAAQAAALDTLKQQLEQVRQFVAQLEKQLPSRAEMDALLSDINQAGVGRGLQFELFRPGQEQVRDHYAELPITVRVTGSYEEIGQFVSDVAHLSRIVTLTNLSIAPTPNRADQLTMEATARTFRYLDPEEIEGRKSNPAKGGAS